MILFILLLLFLSNLPSFAVKIQQKSYKVNVDLLLYPPFGIISNDCKSNPNKTSCSGNGKYEGFAVDLFKMFSERIPGFEYTIKESARAGTRLPLGSWDGSLGKLLNKETDLVIGPIAITMERERVFQFTQPFLTSGVSVMIKKPEKAKVNRFPPSSFLMPFSKTTWLFICFAYLAIGIFYSILKAFPRNLNIHGRKKKSAGEQLITLAFFVFTLFVFGVYTANLAVILQAFQTVEVADFPFQSLTELVRSIPRIKVGVVKDGTTANLFKNQNTELTRELWRHMIEEDTFVTSYAEGIDRVRKSKGKYAFILEDLANQYESNRKPCDTMRLGELMNRFGYGVVLPFGSNLTTSLNLAILTLQENGSLKRLESKWMGEAKSECISPKDLEVKPMSPKDYSIEFSGIAGIFYILMAVLTLALVVVIAEHVACKKKKTPENEALTA
ncbi:unnamed protein product, partial [Mesorhabditis belari]|uniref:Ionotropic glutamate receptor C-terminal domain-containing protein n=1 Tax=Mesorhabditis belari TaxID=2138241 RepID=A0AAF3ESD0_9BILA